MRTNGRERCQSVHIVNGKRDIEGHHEAHAVEEWHLIVDCQLIDSLGKKVLTDLLK
jgi:hypothetical protein